MTDQATLEKKIDGIKGDMVDLTIKLDKALEKQADNVLHTIANLPHSWAIAIGALIIVYGLGYLHGRA